MLQKPAADSSECREETRKRKLDEIAEFQPGQISLFHFSEIKKAKTGPVAKPEATFDDLPGEIRNIIYRLVLPIGQSIKVHKKSRPPALLRVSSKIRSEAEDIYYHENDFSVEIRHTLFQPQLEHWVWKTEPWLKPSGHRVWRNFVSKWLLEYWAAHIHGPHLLEPRISRACWALTEHFGFEKHRRALKALEDMMDYGGNWDEVERVLQYYKPS